MIVGCKRHIHVSLVPNTPPCLTRSEGLAVWYKRSYINPLLSIAYQLLQERFPGKSTSTQSSCSIRPSSADEVGDILKIVGRDDIRCPFAIKGGGHTTREGFSSTTGVQISMAKFTEISYDEKAQTVKIGAGQKWDVVYKELEKYNVTVAGGRVSGVGMGLILGGGYSFITEEHGLTVDTVVAFDLVRPDGSFVEVTETSEPDLFFGLKGGMNNFGIVTSFTLKAYPMGNVWAGVVNYSLEHNEAILKAMSDFCLNNTDVKAVVVASYVVGGPEPVWQFLLFYNGEEEPEAFKPFMRIPSLSSDLGRRKLSNFLEATQIPPPPEGAAHTIPVRRYTVPLLRQIQKSLDQLRETAINDGRSLVSALFFAEHFSEAFSHSTPSAFPHSFDHPLCPSLFWIIYSNPDDAQYFHEAVWKANKAIRAVGIEEGQCKADDLYYPNYAVWDTPVELLYGENLPRLREIRAQVDPKDVMRLTGGFKI